MMMNTDRIRTTHVGSLPKPDSVRTKLELRDKGQLDPDQTSTFPAEVREAVSDVVSKQELSRVDILNDGEMNKVSYVTYVKDRLTGFHGEGRQPTSPEFVEFSEYFGRILGDGLGAMLPACSGPIAYGGQAAVAEDIANLNAAIGSRDKSRAFLTAPSPGCVALHLVNGFYKNDDEYLFAIADAMQTEYEAIHAAGFILQLDCPDLAMGRHLPNHDLTIDQFRRRAQKQVEALNHATRNIPRESMRMHLCWGNYEGPHIHDVDVKDIIDVVLGARPSGISSEMANPRHEHEWRIWEDRKLPEGKVLIPGVIDCKTNIVEHPELVCERLVRLAKLVGRENVVASSDCGFATFTTFHWVHPKITWLKLRSMAEGAELATKLLWS